MSLALVVSVAGAAVSEQPPARHPVSVVLALSFFYIATVSNSPAFRITDRRTLIENGAGDDSRCECVPAQPHIRLTNAISTLPNYTTHHHQMYKIA